MLTQDAKMLHYPLTTDQKENQLFFLSEFNDTGKGMNKKLKVFPESYVENLRDPTKQILKVFLWFTKEVSQCQVENYEQRNNHLTHISFGLTTLVRFLICL